MSTGDSNAPGNYALLDHVACLHYLKENIGKTSLSTSLIFFYLLLCLLSCFFPKSKVIILIADPGILRQYGTEAIDANCFFFQDTLLAFQELSSIHQDFSWTFSNFWSSNSNIGMLMGVRRTYIWLRFIPILGPNLQRWVTVFEVICPCFNFTLKL